MTLALRPLIVAPAEPPQDYAALSTDAIYRLLGRAHCWREMVDTEEDEDEVDAMIGDLRAVLQERGRFGR